MLNLRCASLLLVTSYCLFGCSSTPKKPVDLSQQLATTPLANKLPIPVAHVQVNQLKDTWNAARSGGRRHEGIDILAAHGTKVYSTTNGIIADLRPNTLGGKVIWIKGPSNSWHYYAHLNGHKNGLVVGDYIKKGTHIGYVGNTGNAESTLPHLHYGIYLNGKGIGAVNPYPYLR